MFAIVDIKGAQERVELGRRILVPYMAEKQAGDELVLENVMLLSNEDDIEIGTPFLDEVSFKARVVDHDRGKKVVAFKKKRRTGYKRKIGHVQKYTELEIIEMLKGDEKFAHEPQVKSTEDIREDKVDESPKEG